MNTQTQEDLIFGNLLGELHDKWGWLLALGISFILLGTIGLGMTFALTMVSMMFFGFLMLFGGAFQLIQALGCRGWKSIILHVLVAVAYVIGGVIIISNPLVASEIITMMIAAVFMAVGIMRITMAFQLKVVKGWWISLISGLLSLIFGGMIMTAWPMSGTWIIGLLIAIDMIFHGWGYVALALTAKDSQKSS
ncbi:hypothetical protein AU255_11120 [Methyloprofundus sedimenti]|uniref:HdeD protein n=1 Tax=Methyloprofundus sedimenti TaxID=1420851 RepID=A0A1V8M9X6_9GAMM|nr:HdeD family acid-resistance protein [Methyloprofundus sedimenti]OQK18336.1 hypothetical protein AU255_11120 [Methyloprofundus sedimenti]